MVATGVLGASGEHDWLEVSLLANQAYQFTVDGLTSVAFIEVGTAAALDQSTVGRETLLTDGSQTAATQSVWFTPETTGSYYIDVSDPGTVGGSYDVSAVTVTNDLTDNTTTSGVVTVDGVATTGILGEAGEHDWLKVSLLANQAYAFTVTGLTNDAFVAIGTAAALDEGTTSLATSPADGSQTAATQTLWFTPNTSGSYYIDVSDPGTIGGSYSVSAVTAANDFTDNTTTTGVVTVDDVATTGVLGASGEHDWLMVSLLADQAYAFTVTGLTSDAFIGVGTAAALDEATLSQETPILDGSEIAATQTVWFTPDASGSYYIDISDPGTVGGSYAVSAVTVANDFTDDTTTTGVVTVGDAATTGVLGASSEHDWLQVSLLANQAYAFTVTGLTSDAFIQVGTAAVLDEANLSVSTLLGSSQSMATQTVWFAPDLSGTYYIDISDASTVGGSYQVSAIAVGNDFPDDIATTGVVTVDDAATTGILGESGEHDWLKVSLLANQAYAFTVTGLTNFAFIQVGTAAALDNGLVSQDVRQTPDSQSDVTHTAWFTPSTSGTYYIDISDPGTVGGSYEVSAATVTNDFIDNTTTTGVVTPTGNFQAMPTISGTTAGQTTTDAAALAPFSAVAINDPDLSQIQTVTITLSSTANGTLSNLGGGFYNDGTYTVSGSAADVTAALDGLVFTPTSLQVAPGQTVTTTFTITDIDTAAISVTDSTTTVIATADNVPSPVLTAGASASYAAGAGPTTLDAGLTISDTAPITLTDAMIAVTSGFLVGDTLDPGTLEAGLTSAYNAATGVLTLTGTASLATYQAALDKVTYAFTAAGDPTSNGTDTSRTITWSVNDGATTGTATSSLSVTNSVATFGTLSHTMTSDVFQQADSGVVAIWQLNGATLTASGEIGLNPSPAWQIRGLADFFGNHDTDILWQNSDGSVAIWDMQGSTIAGGGTIGLNPGPDWQIKGTGSFYGAGTSGIVWQNTDGSVAIWNMSGTAITAGGVVGLNPGPDWQIKGTGDFFHNGDADILWQNTDGSVAIWDMKGTTIVGGGLIGLNPGTSWHIEGVGNFFGDGNTDIVWQNDDGSVAIWGMNGTSIAKGDVIALNPGPTWHLMGSGNFFGQGNQSLLFQNDDGSTAIWAMSGTTISQGGVIPANLGSSWHAYGTSGIQFINSEAGNTSLTATARPDQFVFTDATANAYTITGFNAMQDRIELSATQFASFAVVQAATTGVGGGAMINLGNGGSLLLTGVNPASLHPVNFALT